MPAHTPSARPLTQSQSDKDELMPTESRLHHALYTWVYPLLLIGAFVSVCWYCAANWGIR